MTKETRRLQQRISTLEGAFDFVKFLLDAAHNEIRDLQQENEGLENNVTGRDTYIAQLEHRLSQYEELD
jgi:predicted  nucleic acid-binding Zn-ribbon protein